YARELEQALHAAVLAHGAVEHGEHDVDAALLAAADRDRGVAGGAGVRRERDVGRGLVELLEAWISRGAEQEGLLLQEPAAALVDADQDRLEAVAVEHLDDEARGEQRDLVLGRSAAEDHRDAELGPGHGRTLRQ